MAHKYFGGSGEESSTREYAVKNKNRRILKSPAFETRAEVDLYVGGGRITCLECGGDYIHLSSHIGQAHRALGNKDYRKKYNIPHDVPLMGYYLLESHRVKGAKSVKTPEGLAKEKAKLDKAMEKLCAKNGLPRGVRRTASGKFQGRYVKGKEYVVGTFATAEEAGIATAKFRRDFNKNLH